MVGERFREGGISHGLQVGDGCRAAKGGSFDRERTSMVQQVLDGKFREIRGREASSAIERGDHLSMSDYTIYALKGSSECDILQSLKRGEGRFGWSYIETADLRQLKATVDSSGWEALTDEGKNCYQAFLLDLKADDCVIYVNVPEWGRCTIARVTGPYFWRYDGDDFNHRFPVDPESVLVFDRNDAAVHPALSARMKLQGRYWRIYLKEEFEALIKALKSGPTLRVRTLDDHIGFLSKEIQPFLLSITEKIHHTNPN